MAQQTAHQSAARTIESELIDYRFKSFPASQNPVPLAAVAEQKWNALNGCFSLPVMVLKSHALEHNIKLMAAWCERRGVQLAPHAKTTMSPQLVHKQLQAGAWAITVATVSQARVMAEFGVDRFILANQVLSQADLEWICHFRHEDISHELYVLADSIAGVEMMDAALAGMDEPGRPLPVLLELGYNGGRAGCRTRAEAWDVASAISRSPRLDLAGVEGFEGLVPGDTPRARLGAVRTYLAGISETIAELDRGGLLPLNPLVTAGGSSYFDEVVREFVDEWQHSPIRVILRSGCYITHDHGMYARTSPLRHQENPLLPALEVWARVQSVPTAGLAIVGCGRRDVPYDVDMPVVLKLSRAGRERHPARLQVTSLNDQHMFLACSEEDDLQVGDLVCLGISHPCSAFDRWPLIPVVDGSYTVIDAVRTFF